MSRQLSPPVSSLSKRATNDPPPTYGITHLPARQARALGPQSRVVSVRERSDEVVGIGKDGGITDALLGVREKKGEAEGEKVK